MAPTILLRNADRQSAEDRRRLIIDPPRSIAGAAVAEAPVEFSRTMIPPDFCKSGNFHPQRSKPLTNET
jgi:hypothetical protein